MDDQSPSVGAPGFSKEPLLLPFKQPEPVTHATPPNIHQNPDVKKIDQGVVRQVGTTFADIGKQNVARFNKPPSLEAHTISISLKERTKQLEKLIGRINIYIGNLEGAENISSIRILG